jgi:conjugal transfer pilus assembly protein TraF
MKRISLIALLYYSYCSANYFTVHERGWHWYERTQPKKDFETTPSPLSSPLERLKRYREKLETAKAEAVLNPTPENVEAYQKLQYEMLEKSHKFANVWMQNVYRNPELDYSSVSPTSQNARHIHLAEEQRKKEKKISAMSKSYGLFYFFKSNCPYCENFAPIVKKFSEKYHWEVLAIGEAGGKNKMFEKNVRDNGLADIWGVSLYPSLFAVNPKTGDVIRIANGMISIEEMEERISAVLQRKDES